MTEQEEKGLADMFRAVLKRALGREAVMLLGFTCAVGGAALYAQHALAQTVGGQVDAGVRATQQQVEDLGERLRAHERDSGLVHASLKQDLLELRGDQAEIQRDIRALYKAVMTGRPQERLEHPVDGGSP